MPFGTLAVDASWLDATGADGGVGCLAGSLTSARFVTPAGGAFGARGVLDAGGAVATHVVIEPQGATKPAGRPAGAMCLVAERVSLLAVLILERESPVITRQRILR